MGCLEFLLSILLSSGGFDNIAKDLTSVKARKQSLYPNVVELNESYPSLVDLEL